MTKRDTQIIALFENGTPSTQIAKQFGISRSAVSGVISRARRKGLVARPVKQSHANARSGVGSSRSNDDRLLQWLWYRTAGFSIAQVAHLHGAPTSTVSSATSDVRNADITESGEPEAEVVAGYW